MVKRLSFKLNVTAIAVLMLIGCKKSNHSGSVPSAPQPTVQAYTLLTGSIWIPQPGPVRIGFGQDGTYYEDQMNSASIQGTWITRSDSVIITKQFWVEKYKILKCSSDTLKLMNVGSFVTTYSH